MEAKQRMIARMAKNGGKRTWRTKDRKTDIVSILAEFFFYSLGIRIVKFARQNQGLNVSSVLVNSLSSENRSEL